VLLGSEEVWHCIVLVYYHVGVYVSELYCGVCITCAVVVNVTISIA